MSFINWGHESPEQKEIRRRMEERMMFEQASYNAAMAAVAAVGSSLRKPSYVTAGRSSISSYVDENGIYRYYTYNYDSDTLNDIHSTGLMESEYSDRIYVLQDKGFMLRYNGPTHTVYIFTDINGVKIKELTINESDYDDFGIDYNDGVSIMAYTILGNTVDIHLFDGVTVKNYIIDDVYLYGPGSADFYTQSIKNGKTLIIWRSSDSSMYYAGLMLNGEVVVVDSIVAGESIWDINSDWDADFITILKADYITGVYQSFKVINSVGGVLLFTNISSYGHTTLRDENFYGKGKYFFMLGGGISGDLDIWSYSFETNSIIHETVTDGNALDCTAVYHYQDSGYPNGMSNWDDDGIIGINLSSDLAILLYNSIDYYYDGYSTQWYKVDEAYTYTLFDGDDQFYSYDMVGANLTAIKLDDYESLIRSIGEDQSIVLDAFTWDELAGVDQSGEGLQRFSIRANIGTAPVYSVVTTALLVGDTKIHDKFFLGSRLIYAYYYNDGEEEQLQWTAMDSDGQSNITAFIYTDANNTNYFRTHDTLVIIDYTSEITYVVNQLNGHTFQDMNTETSVWYNQVFLSAKNGQDNISPTTEYAFYPNNTGWGSLVLVHDTMINEPDYAKALIVQQDNYFEFTLPMVYGNSWTGELGHNTFLFAWEDLEGGWTANLYDLEGTIISTSKIAIDADLTGQVDLWNLNDRAIISINPNTDTDDYYHYYFSNDTVNSVNVGQTDYWWENDFPAWYFD